MTSTIVYRNPLEQWFWEGGVLWVGAFLAAGLVAVYLCHAATTVIAKLHQKFSDRRNGKARK